MNSEKNMVERNHRDIGAVGIKKVPTGITGFDEIAVGGLPFARTSIVIGGAGTGKTVFALQYLVNGARRYGEPGIFVAFEENSQQLIENAASFGWDLDRLERENLFFLDARMSADTIKAGQFDLSGMLASLKAKADQMKARRIVFDSIGVLLSLMGDPTLERLELYRVHDWLASSGLTGIITARLTGDDLNTLHRYEFLQFMGDCIVVLHHRVTNRVSLRDLRIVKYRGSGFAENEFPMVIGPKGMEVATVDLQWPEYKVSSERVSTGITQLDEMMEGGYFRGSSTLVSGSPGTAKSTLATAFIYACCERGERALYISFDEAASETIRNMASVGIYLQPHIDAGLLFMHSIHSDSRSSEEHLVQLKNYIDEYKPSCLAVDPMSAMLKAGGLMSAMDVTQRLIYLAKNLGITVLMTTLLEGNNPEVEATQLQISTIADTWIHLSYIIQAGERNRAITIIKSRGTAHSNQVRELILSGEGIKLNKVYTAGGAVLMGTMRWEKEIAQAAERERLRAELDKKRREFVVANEEINARIETLRRELAVRQSEMEALESEQALLEKASLDRINELHKLRDQMGKTAARQPENKELKSGQPVQDDNSQEN
jgi:circadian clock protein KaiC